MAKKKNNIKGITIEIGGNTTQLDKALTQSAKKAKEATADIKAIDKALKLDPTNVELLTQKQEALSKQAEITKERYEALNDILANATVDDAGYEAYLKAQEKLEEQLAEVSKAAKEAKANLDQMVDLGFDASDAQFLGSYAKEYEDLIAKQQDLQAQTERLYETMGKPISKEAYDRLQRELVESKDAYDDASKAAKNFDAANAQVEAKARQTSDALSGMADKAKSVGSALTPVSAGAAGIVAAAVAAVPATNEMRIGLSTLEASATQLGYGLEIVQQALQETMRATKGDMGSAIETVSNLLMAKIPEDNLLQTVRELSGAVEAFPNTLKMESLADSLQETLATGEATGQYAELLERLGIDLEAFNRNMGLTLDPIQAQTIALQELTRAGLGQLHEAWLTNNEDLVSSLDAQSELKMATAELAETLVPAMTSLNEILSDVMGWFTELPEGAQKAIMAIVLLTAVAGPLATGIGNILDLGSKLTTKMPGVGAAITDLVTGPGGEALGFVDTAKSGISALWGVISAHPLLTFVAVLGILYATSEDFRDLVNGLFETIIGGIQSVLDWVNKGIDALKDFFSWGKQATGGKTQLEWDTAGPGMYVKGYANGGVFAPNNPMLIGVGDNKTEREIIAPESALMETFLRAAQSIKGNNTLPIINIRFSGSLAQLGRLLDPVITVEQQRAGQEIGGG